MCTYVSSCTGMATGVSRRRWRAGLETMVRGRIHDHGNLTSGQARAEAAVTDLPARDTACDVLAGYPGDH